MIARARTRKLTLLATALIVPGLVLAGFLNLYPVTPQVVLASPDTLVLRPDGAGDSTELTPFPAATANWDCVDDMTSDGDSTYVYSDSNHFGSDFYNFADTPQTGSIDSVTVWMKVRGTRAANNVAKTLIKTNGVVSEGAAQDVTTGYSDISTVYDENPQSNAPWTWDEINLLQAGCALKRAGPSDTTRCTQVWIVVDSTPTPDEYTLTINIVGNGSVAKSPDQATYLDGDTVQLTATANPGWSFDSCSGDLSGSTNPETITMDGDKTVTATFTQDGYTLTINIVGNGSVAKSPDQATYLDGDTVQLTATADPGWTFDSWSGDLSGSTNPETITMDGDKTVTATFTQDEYTLTINIVGNGSVAKSPDQATYHYGDTVQLTATADPGWTFDSWSGDLTGSTNPETITMDGDKSVTATFTQDEYTLTINIVGNGSVAKSPDQATYHDGDTVQLTATADPGWSFDSWSGDLSGSTNPETITMDGDKTVTATFTIYALWVGGGGGGGALPQPPPPPSPPPLDLQVNVLGNITSVDIGEDRVLAGVVIATSADERVTLTFADGTQVLSPDGNPPAELTVETILDPPDAPEGYHVIEAFDFGPDGATFSPPIEIAIRYDPDALPEGVDEANLVIAYYDEAAGEWVFETGVVHPAANTVTFSAGHFTTFAILGACEAVPTPTPTPQLTPTPTTTPGLGTDSWIGMGLCFIGLFGLVVGLIIRRR